MGVFDQRWENSKRRRWLGRKARQALSAAQNLWTNIGQLSKTSLDFQAMAAPFPRLLMRSNEHQGVEVEEREPGVDEGRVEDERGDAPFSDPVEVDLQTLLQETQSRLVEGASDLAALMEVVDDIPPEQRETVMECLRYFYEVYAFLEGED